MFNGCGQYFARIFLTISSRRRSLGLRWNQLTIKHMNGAHYDQ